MVEPTETVFNIPFTQYLRPNGRRRLMKVEVQGDQAIDAERILRKGLVFEIEELSTLKISMTISDGYEDVCIRICKNGPSVMEALGLLINDGIEHIEKE